MCIYMILDLGATRRLLAGWVGGSVITGCRGVEAEAAPGFGDDDAVAGVAGVEADLDGEIDADVADVVRQQADVLGTLVGDARDAVAVGEDAGRGGWAVGGGVREPLSFGDAAVGNAADLGEVVSAGLLDLCGCGSSAGEEPCGDACDGGSAEAESDEIPRVTEQERQMIWDMRKHGVWAKA